MGDNVLCKWMIEILAFLGGFTGLFLIVVGIAKLFGKNVLEYFFKKKLEAYKANRQESLELKKSLQAERVEIVKNLYAIIMDFHKSAKVNIDIHRTENMSVIKTADDNDDSSIIYEVIRVTKENRKEYKDRRIIDASDILDARPYMDVQKEVLSYIQKHEIVLNKEIIDSIRMCITLIEVFVVLNYPKELSIAILENDGYDSSETMDLLDKVEGSKQNAGITHDSISTAIDGLLEHIKDLLRKQIGADC